MKELRAWKSEINRLLVNILSFIMLDFKRLLSPQFIKVTMQTPSLALQRLGYRCLIYEL